MANNCDQISLMPSEIARLVYGYFIETGCSNTAKCFLEESPFMKEFALGLRNGLRYSTKINNQSLVQMLNAKFICSLSPQQNQPNDSEHLNKIHRSSHSLSDYHSTISNSDPFLQRNLFCNKSEMSSLSHDFEPDHRSHHSIIMKDNLSTPRNKLNRSSTNQYSPRRKNATPKRFQTTNHHLFNNQNIKTNNSNLNTSNSSIFHTNQQFHFNSNEMSSNQTYSNVSFSSDSHHHQQIQQQQQLQSMLQIESSPYSTSQTNCESSEIDVEVQPQIIFNELLKCGPLHDKVANTIQKIINPNPNDQNTRSAAGIEHHDSDKTLVSNNIVPNDMNSDNIEKDLLPNDTIVDIIDSLTEEPIFNDFVEMVVEKEIANTPFKIFPSTPSSITNSSLTSQINTPNIYATPVIDESSRADTNVSINRSFPIKNLMKELQTPQKKKDVVIMNNFISDTNLNVSNRNKSNENMVLKQDSLDSSNRTQIVENWKQRINGGGGEIIKPILQNHNFAPKLNRIIDNQKAVQDAINYVPHVDRQRKSLSKSSTNNHSNNHEKSSHLTTKIEIVKNTENSNGEKTSQNNIDSLPTIQLQQQQSENQLINQVEILPVTNWSTATQQIIIPNNQLAWATNNNLVYLSYPTSTEAIYYIDPTKIVTKNDTISIVSQNTSSTKQEVMATTTKTSPEISKIANATTNKQSIVVTTETVRESIPNEIDLSSTTTANSNDDKRTTIQLEDSKSSNTDSEKKQNNSKSMPIILSNKQLKYSPSPAIAIGQQKSQSKPSASRIEGANANRNNTSINSSNRRESDHQSQTSQRSINNVSTNESNILRKKSDVSSSSKSFDTNDLKRKRSDDSNEKSNINSKTETINSKRDSLISDKKIKTLLHSDLDEFLVNIHKNKK
ncbi:Junctophilin-3 [Sarcoptes scabiei]|nr:Junctophilin-3 [Sarcoptes scabiei]